MGAIRNVSGQALYLPVVGTVEDEGVFEVPDEQVYGYTASANFEPVGSESAALHEAAAEEETARVLEEEAARRAGSGSEDHPDAGTDDQPVDPRADDASRGDRGTVVSGSPTHGPAVNEQTGEATPSGQPLPPVPSVEDLTPGG